MFQALDRIFPTLEEILADIQGLILDKAQDFDTGYHLLRSWSYHLVILDIMGVRGFDLLNAAVSLGFPTVMLTAHALSLENLKKSIELGARAFLPKEKMVEIVPFLEELLTLEYGSAWRRTFEWLEGFFSAKFGPDWRKDERRFWDEVISGKYEPKPVILKK